MDKEDKENIILTKEEGAIILRDEGIPEIYAPIGTGDSCDAIRFTLAFIMYAVEKEEWIEEFGKFVDEIQGLQKNDEIELRRSMFEVIDGEKE